VDLAPFRIGKYPVTVSEYLKFLEERTAPDGEPQKWEEQQEHPNWPVVNVTWYQAVAYCEWLAALWNLPVRLPTEAEWEFAARGGFPQRLYPWGDTLPAKQSDRWRDGPEPVGRGEPNGYGLFDMCQNVHEWCSDWYDPGYYAVSPQMDPQGPQHGVRRASKGGAWRHHIKFSRCAARSSIPPDFRYADYGFRVVVAPSRQS